MAQTNQLSAVGMQSNPLTLALRYVALAVTGLIFLFPFYILLRNSLSTEQELTGPDFFWWPETMQWSNLNELFTTTRIDFAGSLYNSAVVAVTQTLVTLLLAALAGYGLARIQSKWSRPVFVATLGTLMIPAAVTFIPTFILVSTLGWVSTFRGLIIPVVFSGFAVFMFRQYFIGFPVELEEAARVDGLGYWRTFWRIVMPNSWGFTAAIGMITFIGAWNSFLWPLVIGQDPTSYTVQISLSAFLNGQRLNLHLLFLGSLIAIMPLMLLFLFLQRYIVQGVESTGIKG